MPSMRLVLVQAEAAERGQRVWEQLTGAGHAAAAAQAGPGPSTAVTGACSGAAGGLSGLACAADGATELDVPPEVRHAACLMDPSAYTAVKALATILAVSPGQSLCGWGSLGAFMFGQCTRCGAKGGLKGGS